MKAIQIIRYGGSEVAEINSSVSEPAPKKDQIMVEVHDASINPFDIAVRSGRYQDHIKMMFPFVPGSDFSGVITKLGDGVSEFKEGDEVYGSANVLNGGSGSFAQFCVSNVKNSALKPKSIDHYYSASLPLTGSSAVQALEDHIKLKSGQKILIHGGAGGIGSIAVQLAKHIGAYVAATVSTNDMTFVKNLGADQVIDYRNKDFTKIIKDFDAVFDTVGAVTSQKSFRVIKKGGILVSMVGTPDPELAKKLGITTIGQNTKTNTIHLSRLAQLIDQGAVKPQVDKIFPMSQIRQAFDYFEKGSPKGKVVLKIKE